MKRFLLFSTVLLSVYSCGNPNQDVEEVIATGDLEKIRSKKAELSTLQSQLNADIATLDKAIERLDKNKRSSLVEVRTVQDSLFQHYVELPGDVETDQNIVINPEVSGILLEVAVEEGQRVAQGALLARIDDNGLSSQLAQLETQAALARTTYERQERLWQQEIGSEIQFLEAKTNYEALQNSVNQLKSQLAKTRVRAPFSGVIDEIFAEEGEVVVPGQSQLFRLINLSEMYITAAVPESYLGQVRKGSEVMVEIGATGTEFTTKVVQVGNFINPNNRTFEIKIAVPADLEQIKPNLIATVKLNDYTAEKAIVIPENILQRNSEGESFVYVLEPDSDSTGVARKRILTTGLSYQEEVEILSGLRPGELLITSGSKSIHDGEAVKTTD